MTVTNLGGIAEPWATTDRVAYVDLTEPEPKMVSFRDFDDLSGRIAAGLLRRGLAEGDRVGILADNSSAFGASYLAMPRVGLVTVPLNTRQSAENLAFVAADAEMAVVLHDRANAHLCPPSVTAIEFGSDEWIDLLAGPPAPVLDIESNQPAIQMYTSGSTGRPKGVLLSHAGQIFSIDLYVNGVMPMEPGERLMVSAPMYHKNAGMQLKMALSLGGTVILLSKFVAADYLHAASEHKATAVSGVPTMFALMAAQPGLVDSLDLSSVQRASIGSAPMTQALFDQASALFPDAVVTNGYGTTEVVAVFGGHPDGLERPSITVGYPLAAVESKLVDPDGHQATPDPATGRTHGELWVRSAGLMLGYHNLPDITAAKVTDGWYHTGDVMESDADGWHYFIGRVDDMFNCGGENVYPGDVEQMLEQCPAVHQAAVVPVPDELKGHLPVAFVVTAPGTAADEQVVKEWALSNGPAYQHPRAVWFVDEIALAGTAKIDKLGLKAEAEARWQPRG